MSKNVFSRFSLIILSLLLILIMVGGYVSAQAPLGTTASTGTGFTYQGYLSDASGAVDATCDFQFSLYDDDSFSPTLVAGPVDKTSVTVSDGHFSTYIDFGASASAFTGEGRQMGIAVRCPAGSGSYTSLSGMVGINAAPYAHSLRPGAVISGSVGLGGAIVKVENTYSNPTFASYGIYGVGDTAGVMGSGDTAGVKGESSASSGRGIWGLASASSGSPYGVYGLASDNGSATSYGVYGKSESSVGTGVGGVAPMNGVYGESTVTSGSSSWGVYGKTNSPNGYGVYGLAGNTSGGYGVYGESEGGFGVYGKASPPDGYGVYSDGNAMINGTLFWKPFTSTISIPGSAFIPQYSTYSYHYEGTGNGITPDDSISTVYFAPVQLPHRATVTEFSFFWTDSSNDDGYAYLYRTDMQGAEDAMARADTSGGSSGGGGGTTVTSSSSDTTIDYATIDNSSYNYYVFVYLPTDINDETIIAQGISIEYTVSQPY